jgi:hypothetical protein
MDELINDMTRVNPDVRPRIEEVVEKLAQIRQSLGGYKLRSVIKSRRSLAYLPLTGWGYTPFERFNIYSRIR